MINNTNKVDSQGDAPKGNGLSGLDSGSFCLTSKLSHAEDDIQNFHKLLAKNCSGHTHWLQRLVRLLRLGDLES